VKLTTDLHIVSMFYNCHLIVIDVINEDM